MVTAEVPSDSWSYQQRIPVHLCGRAYFRKLSESRRADNPNSTQACRSRLILQGRSLCNVLQVISRRLQTLQEDGTQTTQDVRHYEILLSDVEERWRSGDSFAACLHDVEPSTQALCESLFNKCQELLKSIKDSTVEMPGVTMSVYNELVAVQSSLDQLSTHRHTFAEIHPLQLRLDAIQNSRAASGMVFGGLEKTESMLGDVVPKGQAVCADLLHNCYDMIEELTRTAEDVSSEMRYVCSRLHSIRSALIKLQEETGHTKQDLEHYQVMIKDMGDSLQHGLYSVPSGDDDTKGSADFSTRSCIGRPVADQLLKQCYELVQVLQQSSVDMPPAVEAVYAKLVACRSSLEAAVTAAKPDAKALHEALTELENIDNERMRNHGLFGGASEGGPIGQGVCNALLQTCQVLADECIRKSATH